MQSIVATKHNTETIHNLSIDGTTYALTYDDLVLLNGIFQRKDSYQDLLIERYSAELSKDARQILEMYASAYSKKPSQRMYATRRERRDACYRRRASYRGRLSEKIIIRFRVEEALATEQKKLIKDVDVNAAFEELKPIDV